MTYDDATNRLSSVRMVNNHPTLTYEVIYRNESVQPPVEDTARQEPASSKMTNSPPNRNYFVTDEAWGFRALCQGVDRDARAKPGRHLHLAY